jgi:replication factor A2
MDEVTHHGLAALFALKSLQRAPTQSAYGAIGGGGGGGAGAAGYGGGAASTAYGAPGGMVPMSNANNSKAAVEQNVLAVVQGCGDDAGASVQSICDALRLTEKVVREAIDALATDGHVYSTIDDDHYKGCN